MTSYNWPPQGSTGGSGTVTSVGFADGSSTPILGVSGSPVTTAGTLTATLLAQPANTMLLGPTSGGNAQPTFRALVLADTPLLAPLANPTFTGTVTLQNNTITQELTVKGGAFTGFVFQQDGTTGTLGINGTDAGKQIAINAGSNGNLGLNTVNAGGSLYLYGSAGQGAVITGSSWAASSDGGTNFGTDFGGTLTGNRIGIISAVGPVYSNTFAPTAAQTTLTATGTAVCSQPTIGASYKKAVIYLNGYTDTGTQTYTFPTAFAHTPALSGLAAGVAGATVTTTSIKFTVTAQTGFVFAEGF